MGQAVLKMYAIEHGRLTEEIRKESCYALKKEEQRLDTQHDIGISQQKSVTLLSFKLYCMVKL